jgi:hypothetical protein
MSKQAYVLIRFFQFITIAQFLLYYKSMRFGIALYTIILLLPFLLNDIMAEMNIFMDVPPV